MGALDYVIIALIAVIVGGALVYIIKTKKKGKCIGCPHASDCRAHVCECNLKREKNDNK